MSIEQGITGAKLTGIGAGAGAGVTAPLWLEYIQVVFNPLLAFGIAILTVVALSLLIVNRYYKWREDWHKRLKRERKDLLARRKGDK